MWTPDPSQIITAEQKATALREAQLQPLSRRQLLLALLAVGIAAEQVEAEIATIADPIERAAALIEWQAAGSYERDHPLVADLASAFELPPEQVDALWLWAAGL